MLKIKWKRFLSIGFWLLVFWLLVYTRFVNLGWGLPYPMHPDERNMAIAIQELNCEAQNSKLKIQNCFNPHFFAYGQLPLYLAYLIVMIMKFFDGDLGLPIGFSETVIALRFISATASIINAIIIIKIIRVITKEKNKNSQLLNYLITLLLVIFSPFFIQFSHFGTTESLLMLFYSLIIYLSLLYFNNKILNSQFLVLNSLVSGMAVATKISSLIFMILPIMVFISKIKNQKSKIHIKYQIWKIIFFICLYCIISFFLSIVSSPHNLISFKEFLSSIWYESAVATGRLKVFYTRQFENTIPVIFQLTKIFPYALGWMVFILGVLGCLGVFRDWRDKKINLLRLAFLIYFIPNAFLFTKWTRFMAPIMPLMLIFAILTIERIKIIKVIKIIIVITAVIPGIAYLSVYQNPDVRFTASDWIYKNIPENSYILSETANVVDIPFQIQNSEFRIQNYKIISFNFYDLDQETSLQEELIGHLRKADYIFVPSRRIVKNHTCIQDQRSKIKDQSQSLNLKTNKCLYLQKKYPLVNQYYEELFSGKLGFEKVAKINSYPKIQFRIYNSEFKIEFPDEEAEETWSVFDHPVIRVYKKVRSWK